MVVYTVFVPLLLALIIGRLRGGRLARLASVEFKGVWWIFLAFAVQLMLHMLVRFDIELPRIVGSILFSSTYLVILGALLWNRNLPGLWVSMVGVSFNALVIIANGGRMPVLREALVKPEQLGFLHFLESGASPSHIIMTDSTRLWFLGDVLHLPAHWRYHSVFSIGDLLLTAGLFFLIQHLMVHAPEPELNQPSG